MQRELSAHGNLKNKGTEDLFTSALIKITEEEDKEGKEKTGKKGS